MNAGWRCQSGASVVRQTMMISLHPEQQAWLETHVSGGDFASVEEAARRLVELEGDDLAWAKPFVDEAIAAVERGESETLEEHKAHMASLES